MAKFIVSNWGDNVNSGIRCTGPTGYLGWQAGTTTLCLSQLYPPFREYEFQNLATVEQLGFVIYCTVGYSGEGAHCSL